VNTTNFQNSPQAGYAAKRKAANTAIYIILAVLGVIWLFPIIWLILTSFDGETGAVTRSLIPTNWSFNNYIKLFVQYETDANGNEVQVAADAMQFPYMQWILNTLFVAVCSCVISTLLVLMVSYTFSRLRFKSRKTFLNMGLILGMFPGFMSMVAVYAIMKVLGLTNSLIGLIIVYSAGAGLGYQVAKGFFDTIPHALDEAAKIDGATRHQIFWQIILPLSKPIIVYTALTTFMGPWGDYIFVSYFMDQNPYGWTVARGLYEMIDNKENINEWFKPFCAGAVIIAIPITTLFLIMQRFYVGGMTGGAVKG